MRCLREVRILVNYEGSLRSFCKLAFVQRDASLYLFPYAAHGKYFYGRRSMAEHQVEDTFDYTEQDSADQIPKLSIHESGRVHVRVGAQTAGPVHIPPLADLRGEHVATVTVDAFDGLPLFRGVLCESGECIDYMIHVASGVRSGRLVFYVNGRKPVFGYRCRLAFMLRRASLQSPLYVGIAALSQVPLGGSQGTPGVTVIAGFDPTKQLDSEADYLYIRGQ